MNAAESTYIQAESQAWNQYLERLDELNSQLKHTRQILEAAFQTAWNNAVRDWTERESAAWDAYERARAQMLQPPPEGQRQVGALSEGERHVAPPPEGERQPAVGLAPQRALRAASRCTAGRRAIRRATADECPAGSFTEYCRSFQLSAGDTSGWSKHASD
jgi:hypothetical protein